MRLTVPLLLCTIAVASVAVSQTASAQSCESYANQMISIDQQAHRKGCASWTSHSNYQHHFSWCKSQKPGRAQVALNNWTNRLKSCVVAGADPARPNRGDGQFCQGYAQQLMGLWAQGKSKRCKAYMTRNNNYDGHFAWCMSRTKPVAQRAIADNRKAVNACR